MTKSVIGALLLAGGRADRAAVVDRLVREACFGLLNPVAAAEVEGAADEMLRQALLSQDGGQLELATETARVAVLDAYLRESTIVPALGCRAYDALFDDSLLDEICRRQTGLVIPAELRDDCLKVLKWSPSAVICALTPDPMMRGFLTPPNPAFRAQVAEDAQRYFRMALTRQLYIDFQNTGLSRYWFEVRSISEVELCRELTVKGPSGTLLTWTVSERYGVKKAAPELGGGYVHVWLSAIAPDPCAWESASSPGTDAPADATIGSGAPG